MAGKNGKASRVGKHYMRIRGDDKMQIGGQVLVDFTPFRKSKNRTHRSILPTFNHDRRFYTPAFRIPSNDADCEERVVKDHERRVAEALAQITDIVHLIVLQLQPKPRSKQKYCAICKTHYEDYKEHVQGEQHRVSLNKSIFQNHIRWLCDEYQEKCRDLTAKEEECTAVEINSEFIKTLSTDRDLYNFNSLKRMEDEFQNDKCDQQKKEKGELVESVSEGFLETSPNVDNLELVDSSGCCFEGHRSQPLKPSSN